MGKLQPRKVISIIIAPRTCVSPESHHQMVTGYKDLWFAFSFHGMKPHCHCKARASAFRMQLWCIAITSSSKVFTLAKSDPSPLWSSQCPTRSGSWPPPIFILFQWIFLFWVFHKEAVITSAILYLTHTWHGLLTISL